TSWIVNSVVPFSSISSNAASRKRWTRCSARERAALRLRATARSRQAGSFASGTACTPAMWVLLSLGRPVLGPVAGSRPNPPHAALLPDDTARCRDGNHVPTVDRALVERGILKYRQRPTCSQSGGNGMKHVKARALAAA